MTQPKQGSLAFFVASSVPSAFAAQSVLPGSPAPSKRKEPPKCDSGAYGDCPEFEPTKDRRIAESVSLSRRAKTLFLTSTKPYWC